ncbi:hypothetical protein THAOC_23031, partial [Thalassiosira oceanica]
RTRLADRVCREGTGRNPGLPLRPQRGRHCAGKTRAEVEEGTARPTPRRPTGSRGARGAGEGTERAGGASRDPAGTTPQETTTQWCCLPTRHETTRGTELPTPEEGQSTKIPGRKTENLVSLRHDFSLYLTQ